MSGLLLWPTLLYPFARDQAVFAYVAETLLRGGLPYRDAWDLKPPAIYLAYALVLGPAGGGEAGMAAVRAADLLLALLTAGLLVRLAGRWGLPGGSAAAAWWAAVYFHGSAHGQSLEAAWGLAQAETWATPALLGALLAAPEPVEPGREPRGRWLAAGLLLGVAAALKYPAALTVLPVLCWQVCHGRSGNRRLAAFPPLLAGCVAPMAALLAWLLMAGIWDDYVAIQRGFVAAYTGLRAAGPWERLSGVVGHTAGWCLRLWLPPLLALAAAWRPRATGTYRAALLLGGGLAAVWVQGKYFGYHWQTALPGLALLAGAGTQRLLDAAGAGRARWALLALPLAWGLAVRPQDHVDAARRLSGTLSRRDWLSRFGTPGRGDVSHLADRWAADWLRGHTAPDDPVLVWGFEPAVYLLSGRRAPTRFFFNVPVAAPFSPPEWRRELLEDLRRRPPRAVLVLRRDVLPWVSGRLDDSAAQLRAWPELSAWLEGGYRPAGRIEDFSLYLRR